MPYLPGDTYYGMFVTEYPPVGAITADELPVATMNRNGVDDGAVSLTVSELHTGHYKVTGTIPETYEAGDTVHVSVSADVQTIPVVIVVDSFVLDSARIGDIEYSTPEEFAEEMAAAVWDYETRELTDLSSFTIPSGWASSIATAVWAATTKTLSAFSFIVDTADSESIAALGPLVEALTTAVDDIPDDILDEASAIDGKTVRQALQIIAAVAAGKCSGAGTGTETFIGLDGSTERVEFTVDGAGNRTAVSYS